MILQFVFHNVAAEGATPDLRFVEVEDARGFSLNVGTWRDAETHPEHRILSLNIGAAADKVLKVRELRNRLYDEGKTDVAALIDEALGDNPASPVSANEQKVLGEKLEAASVKISQLEAAGIMPAVMAILDERKRQIAREGWTPAHDDEHVLGELATVAACYAMRASSLQLEAHGHSCGDADVLPAAWPQTWNPEWWKPDTAKRMLEKAGALILAEWERLERL